MSKITASELSLLRSRPHSTKLWLSIYKPPTALACQYNNASGTIGAYVIPYDNVTSGAYTDVSPGMTLLVGSAPGKGDYGRVRIRSIIDGTITVAENGNINWTDDLYLTVLDFFEVWPVLPYYVIDGDDVKCYKDYDIEYNNQNSVLGSLVCMGSHYAGWKNNSVFYTASGTYNVAGDNPLFYNWTFEGGSPASATGITPGYVTYATPGHYTTKLVVTSTGTASDTSYRHVSIYDKPNEGTNVPILQWEFDGDLSGSRDEGGYSATIVVHETISSLQDGALVVIFADDDYAGTIQSIGGNCLNRQKIVFVGYVLDGSIRYNYQTSSYTFDVGSVTERMKTQEGPTVSVDSVVTPTSWYELKDMNVYKALYHYLKWHSTILNLADIVYIGDNLPFQYFETDVTSLYDALSTFFKSALVSSVVSDRQGTIWIEPEAMAINHATGTLPHYLDILRQDWMGEPEIIDKAYPTMSFLEMGGVAYGGPSTGTSEAFISAAPNSSPTYFGSPDDRQGLILTSQDQLNILTGNVFAYENSRYPSIAMNLVGNYRNMDIAPLEQFPLTIYSDDTARRITLFRKPFHINSMEWNYDPVGQVFLPSVELHEITQGVIAETVIMPPAYEPNYPPDPTGTDDPLDWPIIPPPTLPYIPPPTTPGSPPDTDPPDCILNQDAAANGPHIFGINGMVSTDGPQIVTFPGWFWIRMPTAVNPTKLLINGCFEKYSCETGWTLDPSPDWVRVYAYTEWGIDLVEGSIDTNGGCGVTTVTFTPPGSTLVAGVAIAVKDGYTVTRNPLVTFDDGTASYEVLDGSVELDLSYELNCFRAREYTSGGHPAITGELLIPVGHPVDGGCIRNIMLDGQLKNIGAAGTEVRIVVEARGGPEGTIELYNSIVSFLGDVWHQGKLLEWDTPAIGTHVYMKFTSIEPADPSIFQFRADNIRVSADGCGRRWRWNSVLLYNWCYKTGGEHL